MNTDLSSALQSYYAREREALATEPAVRAELRALGVVTVSAEYDGVGDSGQIEQISFLDASDAAQTIQIGEATRERVESLLYALLELRHDGWENNDGAFGSFRWNLIDETIEHEHNQRYTDHETSMHEGFEVRAGALP